MFTRRIGQYMSEEEYRLFQDRVAVDPTQGDVIPGTSGFRKMRWADPRRGKGRRGGLRIVYYFFPAQHQLWLMTIYSKKEALDLTPSEKKALKAAIDAELRSRRLRQNAKRLQ